jgi:hypothetical protein
MVSVTPRSRFRPRERTPGTHCTGGWVDPRTCLDTEARRKILCLCRGLNLDRPVVQPVAKHYTDWAVATTVICNFWISTVNYNENSKLVLKTVPGGDFLVLGSNVKTILRTRKEEFRPPWSLFTMWDLKFSLQRVWSSELSSGMYCRVK